MNKDIVLKLLELHNNLQEQVDLLEGQVAELRSIILKKELCGQKTSEENI